MAEIGQPRKPHPEDRRRVPWTAQERETLAQLRAAGVTVKGCARQLPGRTVTAVRDQIAFLELPPAAQNDEWLSLTLPAHLKDRILWARSQTGQSTSAFCRMALERALSEMARDLAWHGYEFGGSLRSDHKPSRLALQARSDDRVHLVRCDR